jgi:hypothetical protein
VPGVQKADCFADPVGAGFHPFGVVVVTGDDGPDAAIQPVISQVGGDRCAGVIADKVGDVLSCEDQKQTSRSVHVGSTEQVFWMQTAGACQVGMS